MAGVAGEQLVATELGRALDDDWTLLRGYRNGRGEIDQLLLGPRGLFAIEVKNLNATVQLNEPADDLERFLADPSQLGSAGWSSSLTGGPGSARCGTRP